MCQIPNAVRKTIQKKAGFTLVELLIVIGLIAMLASTSFVIFSRFSRQQGINVAYEDLRNSLAVAKSSALSQVIVTCTTGVLRGYQVSFTPTSYTIEEVCLPAVATPYRKKTDLIGVTITNNPQAILFLPLSGGVNNAIDVRIDLTNGNASQNRSVTVNSPSGVIE